MESSRWLRRRSGSIALPAATCLLVWSATVFAADFWKEKKPADWTKKEAKRLLTQSPWAKDGPVTNRVQEAGNDPVGVPPHDPHHRDWNLEAPESGKIWTLLVRWESAAPIREAEARLEMEMPDRAGEFYMISVSGFPRKQPLPPPDSREQLKRLAVLRVPGKDAIAPADVDVIEGEQGIILIFFFPRTDLHEIDKQVIFEMNNGPIHVEAAFSLKDMRFRGELTL